MTRYNRRDFLKTASLAAGSSLLASRFSPSAWARPSGANGDVRVAVVGFNQKGAQHIRLFSAIPGVRVVALCDVDPRILAREVEALKANGTNVFATTDVRELLARPDIDAVVIATCNHWHALITIWACQAGKDVYVEKPVCHTMAEGDAMLAAAAKYGRIVQAGTQSRSDRGVAEAVQYIQEGHLGKIQWIHALCYRLRPSIGRRLPWYPGWLNYDLFCGPAPMRPLKRNELHYDWHWEWDTGGGDVANIGVHQLDIARWFAGNPPFPPKVLSFGGRYGVNDAGQTPNTQLVVYGYPEFPVFFEIRGLPIKPGMKAMDHLRGIREGVIVQCEHGYYAGYMGGGMYDNNGRRLKTTDSVGTKDHQANFITAVRSRQISDLHAPLKVGRDSSVCCLAGNLSWRLGQPAPVADIKQALAGYPVADEILGRMQAHLRVHGVDLDRTPFTLGQWVDLDRTSAEITGVAGGDPAALEHARFLRQGLHRHPYEIPTTL